MESRAALWSRAGPKALAPLMVCPATPRKRDLGNLPEQEQSSWVATPLVECSHDLVRSLASSTALPSGIAPRSIDWDRGLLRAANPEYSW